MEFLQIENNFLAIVLMVLAALIPIVIIFYTLRMFRRKRERPAEKEEGLTHKFKSVKEERLEEQNKKKQ